MRRMTWASRAAWFGTGAALAALLALMLVPVTAATTPRVPALVDVQTLASVSALAGASGPGAMPPAPPPPTWRGLPVFNADGSRHVITHEEAISMGGYLGPATLEGRLVPTLEEQQGQAVIDDAIVSVGSAALGVPGVLSGFLGNSAATLEAQAQEIERYNAGRLAAGYTDLLNFTGAMGRAESRAMTRGVAAYGALFAFAAALAIAGWAWRAIASRS